MPVMSLTSVIVISEKLIVVDSAFFVITCKDERVFITFRITPVLRNPPYLDLRSCICVSKKQEQGLQQIYVVGFWEEGLVNTAIVNPTKKTKNSTPTK